MKTILITVRPTASSLPRVVTMESLVSAMPTLASYTPSAQPRELDNDLSRLAWFGHRLLLNLTLQGKKARGLDAVRQANLNKVRLCKVVLPLLVAKMNELGLQPVGPDVIKACEKLIIEYALKVLSVQRVHRGMQSMIEAAKAPHDAVVNDVIGFCVAFNIRLVGQAYTTHGNSSVIRRRYFLIAMSRPDAV